MAVEIEAKLRVQNFEQVRSRLVECNAAEVGQFLETNIFFDTVDRSLLSADCGLRLRRNHNVATGDETLIITHKGPRETGPVKSREETELEVAREDAAIQLLAQLGYEVIIRFEKRRQSFDLDDCRVELDEMPRLGCFVEIEGPSVESVQAAQRRLHLEHQPHERHAYVALLMGRLQETRDESRNIVFS